jgi:hypothetical protein
VERDAVAWRRRGDKREAVVTPTCGTLRGAAQAKHPVLVEQWAGEHGHRLAVDGDHPARRRPALVEDVQRLLDDPRAEEPEPR